MPQRSGSLYPADWVKKAADDFTRVKKRLEDDDVEDAAFHLQQALEKYLKGFLIAHGWTLKKIHDLEALLDDAVRYDAALPPTHPLALRFNPATLDAVDRAAVAAFIAQAAALRNLTVDFARGPIGEIVIEGRRDAIYA